MAVQDLTPQLRTRLSKVERVVGVFVTLASLLLLAGFGYYVYHTGARKGWWVDKFPYHTFVDSGAGLHVGDLVQMLGFEVGRITEITPLEPEMIIYGDYGNIYVQFEIRAPYHGYIWTDSRVRVNAGDLLGGRFLEVIPGGASVKADPSAAVFATYQKMTNGGTYTVFNEGNYEPMEKFPKGFWLPANESPAVTERLQELATQVETALPGILDLTNRLALVLSNVAGMTAEAQGLLAEARPTLSNVTVITANLTQPQGSLGEWILPTNLHAQLLTTLSTANLTLTNVNNTIVNTDSNVTTLAMGLDDTLINLGNITSNLNQQVQSNTNIVKQVSDLIVNANEMIQGLKGHWLLRSAFKNDEKEEEEKSNQPRRRAPPPRAGKWREYP